MACKGCKKKCTIYARSCVQVNGRVSDEFEVNVNIHQGSILSSLLFIVVLEALLMELRTGCPWGFTLCR